MKSRQARQTWRACLFVDLFVGLFRRVVSRARLPHTSPAIRTLQLPLVGGSLARNFCGFCSNSSTHGAQQKPIS